MNAKERKKLALLQAQAETKRKLRFSELEREVATQAKSRKMLEKSWETMMYKIKEPLFRQDIEIMRSTFERVLDKKDHEIANTMRLMDVADDQYQRTIASFCDVVDNMITKFMADLDNLCKENDFKTAKLLKEGDDNACYIMNDQNSAETHLKLLLYHGHTTADSQNWTTRGENFVKKDEETGKYFEIREDLRSFLENYYSALWDEYKAVLKAYVVNTADTQRQLKKLRAKQNVMVDLIASQGKKIANSGDMLKRLRTELAAYESGTKQAVFRDRRNRHRDACHRLKSSLYNGVDTDMKQLAILVKSSDDTVEWLEAAYKKGEKILRMAALCRKFETQREKVLPYGSTMPHAPTQAKIGVRRQLSDDSLVVNAISSTCGLTKLWQRVSKAELSKRALFREKMLLEHDNAVLRERLKARSEEQVGPDTFKCICHPAQNSKIPIVSQPNAVEGALEVRKFLGFEI